MNLGVHTSRHSIDQIHNLLTIRLNCCYWWVWKMETGAV